MAAVEGTPCDIQTGSLQLAGKPFSDREWQHAVVTPVCDEDGQTPAAGKTIDPCRLVDGGAAKQDERGQFLIGLNAISPLTIAPCENPPSTIGPAMSFR